MHRKSRIYPNPKFVFAVVLEITSRFVLVKKKKRLGVRYTLRSPALTSFKGRPKLFEGWVSTFNKGFRIRGNKDGPSLTQRFYTWRWGGRISGSRDLR